MEQLQNQLKVNASYTLKRKLPLFRNNSLMKTVSNEISLSERNPVGRTGMVGRGLLGRWGPNHAADPVVTRYTLVLYNCSVRLYALPPSNTNAALHNCLSL